MLICVHYSEEEVETMINEISELQRIRKDPEYYKHFEKLKEILEIELRERIRRRPVCS